MVNRRDFISAAALAGASLTMPPESWTRPSVNLDRFDFIFLTDTHIQRELAAADGCAMCFKKIHSSVKADFAIQGGDLVFDALGVDRQRAHSLYDLYAETEQGLGLKVYHAIGNHDIFGVYERSGVSTADQEFGKRMFQDRIGQTYYSFDHKGCHFVILDSIQVTSNRSWQASIDAEQLKWLRSDLAAVKTEDPIVVSIHVPLLSGVAANLFPAAAKNNQLVVANAHEVISTFEGHKILAVLQGHLHINEVDTFKGIPFLTSGAVSGNWWHGTHEGTPEGYTVVSLRRGKISWRYETYGFKSITSQIPE